MGALGAISMASTHKIEEFARFLKRACNCGNGFEKNGMSICVVLKLKTDVLIKFFMKKILGALGTR